MKAEVVLIAALAAGPVSGLAAATSPHHAMVMSHGARVMRFDQKTAMHMFTPNASGGTIEIMVHSMDASQIMLVRRHLRAEAAKFAVGDYSDPAFIHGATMPGLSAMRSSLVAVRYSDTGMGAKITFMAAETPAIASIHQWLAAQAADHGSMPAHCNMKM